MLFSELFDIEMPEDKEWFNPILHQDTKLFIDPFLVFKSNHPIFQGIYDMMMEFFNKTFELIAMSSGNPKNIYYRKAVSMLRFHEVNELCLGYSGSRDGAGPGPKWAETLAANISQCIAHDILKLRHFEEIGLFSVGIGPDSISDIAANLLKERLVIYTKEICGKYGLETKKVKMQNANFDWEYLRWNHQEIELPINPCKNRNTGILLIPKEFLREIPQINTEDFYATILENQSLRNDLNFEIDKNLNKEQLAQIARKNYGIVEKYVEIVEEKEPNPYNLNIDPKLKHKWYVESKEFVTNNPLKLCIPKSSEMFFQLVKEISSNFKNYIENKSGYKLLWDDHFMRGKSEEAVQLLFHGIIEQHCIVNNIDLTREVNQGRGPVDFRFSNGYSKRTLLEIKLARNSKFWHGLEVQLPKYLEIDVCKDGIFLVVVYTEKDWDKIKDIRKRMEVVNRKYNLNVEVLVVDAIPAKASASKL